MDNYTFINSFNEGKEFQFSVKLDFLDICPNPEDYSNYELLTIFKINHYFHNANGPAIVRLNDDVREFWVDGYKLNEKELN